MIFTNNYLQACSLVIAHSNICPEMRPAPTIMSELNDTIRRCTTPYEPAKSELQLEGVFIYSGEMQRLEDVRRAFAVVQSVGNNAAVIGVNRNLLIMGIPPFNDFVFMHELAHLCSSGENFPHDEVFQQRLTEIFFNYCLNSHLHGDGKQTIIRCQNWHI